jgi:hypothetical protein
MKLNFLLGAPFYARFWRRVGHHASPPRPLFIRSVQEICGFFSGLTQTPPPAPHIANDWVVCRSQRPPIISLNDH